MTEEEIMDITKDIREEQAEEFAFFNILAPEMHADEQARLETEGI